MLFLSSSFSSSSLPSSSFGLFFGFLIRFPRLKSRVFGRERDIACFQTRVQARASASEFLHRVHVHVRFRARMRFHGRSHALVQAGVVVTAVLGFLLYFTRVGENKLKDQRKSQEPKKIITIFRCFCLQMLSPFSKAKGVERPMSRSDLFIQLFPGMNKLV